MTLSYANVFLAKLETDAHTHTPHQPHTWWRVVDDIFMIWTYTEDDLAPLSLTSTTFTLLSNSLHPIQQHLFLFLTSRSHSANLAWLRPISIINRQINFNTFYNCYVTPYILNEPFHSALLSDYDAYAFPTKASLYAPMNSSNTLTIVYTTSLSRNPTSSCSCMQEST